MNKKAFLELIIDTNANPTVKQLMSVGVSEGNAVEMLMRMANANTEKVVANAKELYRKEMMK